MRSWPRWRPTGPRSTRRLAEIGKLGLAAGSLPGRTRGRRGRNGPGDHRLGRRPARHRGRHRTDPVAVGRTGRAGSLASSRCSANAQKAQDCSRHPQATGCGPPGARLEAGRGGRQPRSAARGRLNESEPATLAALEAGDPDLAAPKLDAAKASAGLAQATVDKVQKARAFCQRDLPDRGRETERLRTALPQAEIYQNDLDREFAPSSWQAVVAQSRASPGTPGDLRSTRHKRPPQQRHRPGKSMCRQPIDGRRACQAAADRAPFDVGAGRAAQLL